MTAPSVDGRFAVRVMVTPVWDNLPIQVTDVTTIAELKRDALRTALKRSDVDDQLEDGTLPRLSLFYLR